MTVGGRGAVLVCGLLGGVGMSGGCRGGEGAGHEGATRGAETSTGQGTDAQGDGESSGSAGEGADGESESGTTGEPPPPFEPLPPVSALTKAKGFVTGLPPTDAELAAYVDDPATLSAMVDDWLETPEFRARTVTIFDQLLQQHASSANLAEHFDLSANDFSAAEDRTEGRLVAALGHAFAQTAWELVAQGRPFTEILTTRRMQLDVPQMMLLAAMDALPRDDVGGDLPSWVADAYPEMTLSVRWTGEPIPLASTLDPMSPDFMTWWLDQPPTDSCIAQLEGQSWTGRKAVQRAFELMLRLTPAKNGCSIGPQVFGEQDWELRPITVRVAEEGEQPMAFFDLATLRTTDELVLASDRVGFFTTLGFSANWLTNDSNQHRVNGNQTLIVALGRTFDPENVFVPADGAQVDEGHAEPGSTCYGCHKDLDPLRDFLRQSYTYAGMWRPDALQAEIPNVAYFSLEGSEPIAGRGVGDLAAAMAQHPRFAAAWTEKLCTLANADACVADDPELERIAARFADTDFDYRVLVKELVTSPVFTFASRTATSDELGTPVLPVTQDRFCAAMSQRVGVVDICALEGVLDAPKPLLKRHAALSFGVPPVSYGRSAERPFVATRPDVFSVAAIERLCLSIAEQWYGDQPGALWTPADRDDVLDHLVTEVMGIPMADPRASELRVVLDQHWTHTSDDGATEADALRSTFVSACVSAAVASTSM